MFTSLLSTLLTDSVELSFRKTSVKKSNVRGLKDGVVVSLMYNFNVQVESSGSEDLDSEPSTLGP